MSIFSCRMSRDVDDCLWNKQRPPKESKQRLFIQSLLQWGGGHQGLHLAATQRPAEKGRKSTVESGKVPGALLGQTAGEVAHS